VAQRVILSNRAKNPQPHPPLVHINVEVSGQMDNWDAYNDQVLAKIKTMLMPVYAVFGDDVQVLTTYSYKHEKKFYPTKVDVSMTDETETVDRRESFPMDVTRQLIDQSFTRTELERRENAYRQYMLDEKTGKGI
jgi:hypothetical protein